MRTYRSLLVSVLVSVLTVVLAVSVVAARRPGRPSIQARAALQRQDA